MSKEHFRLPGCKASAKDESNSRFSEEEMEKIRAIRQSSRYDDNNKARPENNLFFETKSNPLSSKGN